MFLVVEEIYTDTNFQKSAGEPKTHGPFETTEEAKLCWKAVAFKNIDNYYHRAYIKEV